MALFSHSLRNLRRTRVNQRIGAVVACYHKNVSYVVHYFDRGDGLLTHVWNGLSETWLVLKFTMVLQIYRCFRLATCTAILGLYNPLVSAWYSWFKGRMSFLKAAKSVKFIMQARILRKLTHGADVLRGYKIITCRSAAICMEKPARIIFRQMEQYNLLSVFHLNGRANDHFRTNGTGQISPCIMELVWWEKMVQWYSSGTAV